MNGTRSRTSSGKLKQSITVDNALSSQTGLSYIGVLHCCLAVPSCKHEDRLQGTGGLQDDRHGVRVQGVGGPQDDRHEDKVQGVGGPQDDRHGNRVQGVGDPQDASDPMLKCHSTDAEDLSGSYGNKNAGI